MSLGPDADPVEDAKECELELVLLLFTGRLREDEAARDSFPDTEGAPVLMV